MVVHLCSDRRLLCYPHSTAATAVLYRGLYDWSEMNFLLQYLRPGDCFVDVGANVGVYSLLATAVDGTTVIAVEPSTATADRLEENVRLNGLEDRIAVGRVAAGATSGGEVEVTKGLDARNRVVRPTRFVQGQPRSEAPPAESETVPLATVDSLTAGSAVALLKVDVEGYEFEVLSGATDLLESHRPALILETNDVEPVRMLLDRHGYTVVSYDPATRRLEAKGPLRATAGSKNVLAVADLDEAAARLGDGGRN